MREHNLTSTVIMKLADEWPAKTCAAKRKQISSLLRDGNSHLAKRTRAG